MRTAGGYTIVPEGKTNWSICAPGRSSREATPHLGRPPRHRERRYPLGLHPLERLSLPDGTRIHCKTSSETGQSVSTGLTIANGADKVNVTGVDGKPQTGEITHDGYEWRLSTWRTRRTSRPSVWAATRENPVVQEKNGANLGDHQGAQGGRQLRADHRPEPEVLGGRPDAPGGGDPPLGNQFRTEVTDLLSQQVLPPNIASLFGNFMHANHRLVEQEMDRLAQGLPIGGLANEFNSWEQVQDFIVGLGDHARAAGYE